MTVTGLCRGGMFPAADQAGRRAALDDTKRAGKKLLAYHVNDWLVPTTDLLLDRGMMGDGVIDLRTIRAAVEAAGYRGHCEVEILSANNWWKRDPDEVLRICIERHQTVV